MSAVVKRLRFGVVGCGAHSIAYQLPALRLCPHAELVAVADLDERWAQAVAKQHQVPEFYDDHHDLVGRVDAALIATPNMTHADISCFFLEHGVHVLCEKPMATTQADVDRMYTSSVRGGARVMAAHCLRFSPNLQLLKGVISKGWLGTVNEMTAGLGAPYDAGQHRTEFRKERKLSGGGVLLDLGIHLIDLAVWLAGAAPVAIAYDASSVPGWEVETDADVALEFPGGIRACLSSSFTHGLENAIVVRGDAGWASAPLHIPTSLTLFSTRARICRRSGLQHLLLPDKSMYERQIDHFCDAILAGEDFGVKRHEVRADIDVIERCYRGQQANAA